jgi:3-dehydroquinate synthase
LNERSLHWRHARGTCALRLGSGVFEGLLAEHLGGRRGEAVCIVDAQVLELHRLRLEQAFGSSGEIRLLAVPGGEEAKTLRALERLLEEFAEVRLPRDGIAFAVGGGACTDLVGLAAALWMRGIAWVAVPTTLLALVDASVGGKTAINLGAAKNLVGAFHAPEAVALDPSFLRTLPERELRSGLAEVVKAALLSADQSFAELERFDPALDPGSAAWADVIERALRLKIDIVERDERESGPRRALNLGHTLAHGLEHASGYGALRHGEAVAIGLVAACDLAVARGLLDRAARERVVALLARLGLPLAPPADTDIDAVLRALRLDKKVSRGRLNYVLPRALPARANGDVAFVDDVDTEELERWLYSSIASSSPVSQ